MLACVLTAVVVLAAPALVPSATSAGTLDFPYVNTFPTAAGGTLSGDAAVVDGRLRLTEDAVNQAGAWSTDDTFPADVGLEIEFTYAMWKKNPDQGADGLLLFLADGDAPQGVGAFGAALGYACRSSMSQGGVLPCDLPGVPGGFAAVALDHYGNFSTDINGSGPGQRPDNVVVRGSGNGISGYRYVRGVPAPGGVLSGGPTPRKVRITLLPGDTGELSMTVRLESGGVMRTVLDRVPLHGDGQAPLPSTLRLGFAGSTGSNANVHEVDSLRVWKPADLAVEQDLPATVGVGDEVEYTVTARNVGPNESTPSRLDVDVPDALRDVHWTCAPDAGSTCGAPSGAADDPGGDVVTEVGLPRGGSATVTVTGRLPEDAGGELVSVATVTPAPPMADVHEDDNVSRATATVGAPAEAHVETDKSVSPATGITPGDEVEYLVTARNRGPGTAQDVGAVDELPAAMRFVGSEDGCTAAGQVVTCASGTSLAVGASTAFRIRAVLDPEYEGDGSDVVNVATATSPTDPDGGDPSPGVGIGVVPGDGGPGDGGPGDGGPGDGGPGDGGPGDGGPGHGGPGGATPGAGTPDDRADGGPDRAGTGDGHPGRGGALAYTGAAGLGILGALGAVTVAAGGACWWLARRRTRRLVPPTDGALPLD